MWFIGVEVEQETSAPPPKKILDPPLQGPAEVLVLEAKGIVGRLIPLGPRELSAMERLRL